MVAKAARIPSQKKINPAIKQETVVATVVVWRCVAVDRAKSLKSFAVEYKLSSNSFIKYTPCKNLMEPIAIADESFVKK